MNFFRIDGRSGPNILRLDFLFHIYIVNCILIKKICYPKYNYMYYMYIIIIIIIIIICYTIYNIQYTYSIYYYYIIICHVEMIDRSKKRAR